MASAGAGESKAERGAAAHKRRGWKQLPGNHPDLSNRERDAWYRAARQVEGAAAALNTVYSCEPRLPARVGLDASMDDIRAQVAAMGDICVAFGIGTKDVDDLILALQHLKAVARKAGKAGGSSRKGV